MSGPAVSELPLVSVCIPTFNRVNKLRRAVTRLRESQYQNLEIIISDNASSDDTQTFCEVLCASDARFRYYRHSVNRGPTANFEFARAQAVGKYFIWLGDDDYLADDFIELCIQELERDRDLVLAAGVAHYHSNDGSLVRFGNVIQAESNAPFLRVVTYLGLVRDNAIFCGVYRRVLPLDVERQTFWAATGPGSARFCLSERLELLTMP